MHCRIRYVSVGRRLRDWASCLTLHNVTSSDPSIPSGDRSPEKIQIDWPLLASVSEPASRRFHEVVDTHESADDAPPPGGIPEAAARSVANGASLAAVAQWFDVPESQLHQMISGLGDHAAADSAAGAAPKSLIADNVRPSEPFPAESRESGKSATASHRPAQRRSTSARYSASSAIGTTRRPSPPSQVGLGDHLRFLRRRPLIVVAALVLAGAAGWVTAPGEIRRATTFRATHTVIYEPTDGQSYNIEQVALLATSGEVPSRVAARLKLDRGQVRGAVTAEAEPEVATISITGRSSTAEGAASLADVTAEELAAEIDGAGQMSYQAEVTRLTAQLQAARNRLNGAKNPAAQAAAQADVQTAERSLEQFQAKGPTKSQLRMLEKAAASAVNPPGVQAPDSKPVRAALLGGLGLIIGIAGAFGLDRLDSRIRSKATAEEAFGAPVLAEVPRISKDAEGQLLAVTQPSSPLVEAYRALRTYVALWAPETGEDDGHRVIMVTSAQPSEGKTTTVAHLAAMLAEIGRSVLVVSADLRRPRIHQYFDRPGSPGLVDVLAATPGAPTFDEVELATPVRGVRLVPSGPAVENPAPLLEQAGDLLRAARGLADFVLVDTPPLLVANDAVDLARHTDGVLLVARAGQTPIEAAEHCAELLGRLEIPIVGTVLVGSESASNASRYYSSRYYVEPERSGRRHRRVRGASNADTGPRSLPPSPIE